MKLSFDENGSPGLVNELAGLFLESAHVDGLVLAGASDQVVWDFAKAKGVTIVSNNSVSTDEVCSWAIHPR